MLASTFFILGTWFKEKNLLKYVNTYSAIIGVLLVTLGAFLWTASLLNFKPWQVLPYIISALGGIFMVYYVSFWIEKSKGKIFIFLNYVGAHTLTILTWHFLSFKIISLIIININNLPIKALADFPIIRDYSQKGWWVAYLMAGVFLPLLGVKLKAQICITEKKE